MSFRSALFAPHETLSVRQAVGRICGAPVISCPPRVPIVSSGEVFSEETVRLCEKYGIDYVEVVCGV
jgi:arginine/lysine/ornithine decarboxylase